MATTEMEAGEDPRAYDGPCLAAPADRPFVLGATIIGSAMGFIDGAIVSVAMPAIEADFDAPFSTLQWIHSGYLLTLSAFLITGGGLGDRIGRRRIFVWGVGLFAVASVLCALAPTAWSLVAARALQGVGAAMMIPQSLSIIAVSFPKAERGAAIGLWASASALTTVAAPALGGALIGAFGWESVFWINLPLAAVAIALAVWRVPESRAAGDGPIDWAGSALAVAALGALTWGVVVWPERGLDLWIVAALALGVGLAVAFWRVEQRAPAPIAPPSLFRARDLFSANVVTLLVYGALGTVLFLLPFDLMGRRAHTALEAGLALTPFGLVIGLGARWGGALADRVGFRTPLTLGALGLTIGCAWLAVAPLSGPSLVGWLIGVGPAVLIMGLSMTMVAAPLATAAVSLAPGGRSGASSGLNNAVSRLSSLLAVAVVGAGSAALFAALSPDATVDFAEAVSRADPLSPADAAARDAALALGYLGCAALAAAGALAARRLPGAPAEAS